jgi:segregation and condensation protein B
VSETARQVEALLFLSPEPLALNVLAELTDADAEEVVGALDELAERHGEDGGLEVAQLAGGYVLRTRAELEDVCDRLRERPPEDRLSPAALETLAVVAYLEPVSRPDIGRLRGVSVDSTVAHLVERGLLEEAGRADGSGAMRYRTTRSFQKRFGLRDQRDLPPIERFELTGEEAEDLHRRLVEAGHVRLPEPAALPPVPDADDTAEHDEPDDPAGA